MREVTMSEFAQAQVAGADVSDVGLALTQEPALSITSTQRTPSLTSGTGPGRRWHRGRSSHALFTSYPGPQVRTGRGPGSGAQSATEQSRQHRSAAGRAGAGCAATSLILGNTTQHLLDVLTASGVAGLAAGTARGGTAHVFHLSMKLMLGSFDHLVRTDVVGEK